jgi:hypothetical protein
MRACLFGLPLWIFLAFVLHPRGGTEWGLFFLVIVAPALLFATIVGFAYELGWLQGRRLQVYRLAAASAFVLAAQVMAWLWDISTWLDLFGMCLIAASVIAYTRFWRQWLPWRQRERTSIPVIIVETFVALMMLVVLFSGLESLLIAKGYIETREEVGGHPTPKLEAFHAWQFLDAVPGLKITETVNWERPKYAASSQTATSQYVSGALLLVFKLLVILPVLAAGKDIWDEHKRSQSRAPYPAPQ